MVDYSERLMNLHTNPLSVLQMGCSGTEAIEIAIKMARAATGKGIICSNATYHGNSHETIRMTIGPFEPDFKEYLSQKNLDRLKKVYQKTSFVICILKKLKELLMNSLKQISH